MNSARLKKHRRRLLWAAAAVSLLILSGYVWSLRDRVTIGGQTLRQWSKDRVSSDLHAQKRAEEAFARIEDPVRACTALLKLGPSPGESVYSFVYARLIPVLPLAQRQKFPPPNFDYTTPRYMALARLGELGPSASNSVPAVQSLLDHPNPMLRAAAARTLGGIGPPAIRAVPKLIEALVDENWLFSKDAAVALGRIAAGEVAVRRALESALKHPEPELVKTVREVLRTFDALDQGSEPRHP